jgi:hypothetical protein
MSQETIPEETRRDNSATLWNIVQTFSQEAQAAAKNKAIELGFSLERGSIPFEETLINLSGNRDLLLASIESKALTLLPLKIQNTLIADAKKISGHLTALANGTDTVLPLENAVDDLTATVWYSNLQNMSGEVLGLQEKINQLKTLERELRELGRRADAFKTSEERAASALSLLDASAHKLEGSADDLAKISQEARQQADSAREAEAKATASLLSAQQSEKNAVESAATARAASAEADSLRNRANAATSELETTRAAYSLLTSELATSKLQTETSLEETRGFQRKAYEDLDKRSQAELAQIIKSTGEKEALLVSTINATLGSSVEAFGTQSVALAGEFRAAEILRAQTAASQITVSKAAFEKEVSESEERYKKLFTELKEVAESNIAGHNISATELIARLRELEGQVDGAILRATGFSLFHSFQKRQEDLQRSTRFWAYGLAVCASLSVIASLTFLHYLPYFSSQGPAIYFKISLSLPFIFALTFCALQYTRERRLEEEYAFKSNISISLKPYQKLVEEVVNQSDPAERAIYTKFIIDSIGRIFNSPTGLVFDGDATDGQTATGLLKVAGDVAENIIKTKMKG